MALIITVNHLSVNAVLAQLLQQMGNTAPVLAAVGEDLVERTKQRFASTTGPDGVRWRPNTRATIMNYLRKKKGFSGKTGKITAKGQSLAISKRPLQGESRDLAREIDYNVANEALTMGATPKWAAMQHFGGTKAQFPKLWGDIPARPFMPINAQGELYPAEADLIVEQLRQYLLA